MVITQFEDEALLPNFEALCRVAGVDVCLIGPRDLSLNMGFADGPNHPEVQAVIDQAIAVMKKANISAGITAVNREDAAKQVARGANMILAPAQNLVLSAAKAFLPEKLF